VSKRPLKCAVLTGSIEVLFVEQMGIEPMSGCLHFAASIFNVDSNHTVAMTKSDSNGILAYNTVYSCGEDGIRTHILY
jgi:hypothetical protein